MKILTRKKQKKAIELIENIYNIAVRKMSIESFKNGNFVAFVSDCIDLMEIVGSVKDLEESEERIGGDYV